MRNDYVGLPTSIGDRRSPPTPYYELDAAYRPQGGELAETLRKLWRRKGLILAITGGTVAVAMIVATQITPRYTAESQLRVGLPEARLTNIQSVVAGQGADTATVQSEGYSLQSRELVGRVVDRLALDKSPEFNPELREPTLLDRVHPGRLVAMLRPRPAQDSSAGQSAGGGDAEPQSDPKREKVIDTVLSKIGVEPMGRSHVIAVRAESENPATAASIANSLAKTYIEEKMVRGLEATDRADEWLSRHISSLRKQLEEDERAVEEYRRTHGLYVSRSDTITAQQLAELNTQLIIAQAQKAEADARLAQAKSLTGSDTGGTLPEAIHSPLIQALKQQQSTVQRRAAELSTRYGPKHPSMVDVRAELKDIRDKIRGEVSNLTAGLRNEAATAKARYEALRSNMEAIKKEMGQDNASTIKLRALEREADASRALFQQFLERSKETDVQRDLRQSDARVISRAAVPGSPSYPPTMLLLTLALVGGAVAGILLVLVLEQLDSTFRTDDEVEERTALPVLSVIPRIARRHLAKGDVMKHPTSEFSEAMRKLEMTLRLSDKEGKAKVVMMASAVPNEGKSGICLSLARIAAASGLNVIVIDCDWRKPQLHSMMDKVNGQGVGDLLAGRVGPEDVVYRDSSGAHMIFAGQLRPRHAHLLCSDRMRHLLQSLTKHYDLVLVDTPPVLVGSEVLYLSQLVDKAVYVVRWGHTRRDVAMKGLRQLLDMRAPVAGIVLSQVDTRRYHRYVQYGDDSSYRSAPMGRAA